MDALPRNVKGKNTINFSKALSKLLRHDAQNQGVEIRSDGFCNLDEVLAVKYIKKFNPTIADVQAIVEDNNKKRFELVPNPDYPNLYLIRAVQGHSLTEVKNEDLLVSIGGSLKDEVNVFQFKSVIHGTYKKVIGEIMKLGVSKMSRTNIHMARNLPGEDGVISGMRGSCEMVIDININQAVIDGKLPFFLSNNDVILCPGAGPEGRIPSQYFRHVYELKSGKYFLQQEIEYLCLWDLKTNISEKKKDLPVFELVEMNVIIVHAQKMKVCSEFSTFVRPTHVKQLTQMTTDKYGITNEMCFGATEAEAAKIPTFQQALHQLHGFLLENGVFQSEFAFVSSKDIEGCVIYNESTYKKVDVPNYLTRRICMHKVFPMDVAPQDPSQLAEKYFANCAKQWNKHGQVQEVKKAVAKNTQVMLEALGMTAIGTEGKSLDDVKNLVSVVIKLLQSGFVFNQAMVLQK